MRRREVLAGVGAATLSLAGCVYADPPDHCDPDAPPPVGFRLVNSSGNARAVEIEVVRDFLVHVETVFDEEYELGVGESVEVADVLDVAGRHILFARLDTGDEERLYWQVSPDGCNPVLISVADDGLYIEEPSGVDSGPPGGQQGGGA